MHRRVRQLHRTASVPVDLPQDAFGEGGIGYELTIPGEGDIVGGDASEKRLGFLWRRVDARKLTAQGVAGREDFRPVLTGIRWGPSDRTRSQLNGLGRRLPQQPSPFIKRPNLIYGPRRFMRREYEELPIRGPTAAACSARGVPTGEQRMKI